MTAASIKIAIRHFYKQKAHSIINLSGLAIGMAVALFILIWVHDEKKYDRFHDNAHRIFRVTQIHDIKGELETYTNTPTILAEALMQECPEIETATSIRNDREGTLVSVDDRHYHEPRIGLADRRFFRLFTFPLVQGDPEKALASPGSVVISRKAASRYFGRTDPMGRTLSCYGHDFLVTGVMDDMPPHSHFHFDVLCSKNSFPRWLEPDWSWNPFKTYVSIRSGADMQALQARLNDIAVTRMCGDNYTTFVAEGNSKSLPLQPLTDIHLHSHMLGEFESNGNALHVRFFTLIAGFILLIAAVNYTNLSTARSMGRAREVGIRKTVGSSRSSLIRQFLGESVLMSLLALMAALITVAVLMPAFGRLVGKPWLETPYLVTPLLILPLILLAVVTGLAAGLYPSLILSAFPPASVLGGKSGTGLGQMRLRNGLVVFQFAVSVLLLTGTLIVGKQMAYAQNRDLGFQRDHVVVLQTLGQVGAKLRVFKDALLEDSGVVAVSASSSVPGKGYRHVGFHVEGSQDSWPATICIAADADFPKVMQLQLEEGRFFSDKISTDRRAVIFNTSKARAIGSENLYQERIIIGSLGQEPFHVIGSVRDFHYESFHEPVKPMGIVLLSETSGWSEDYVSIRIRPADVAKTLAAIEAAWKEIVPGSPLNYSFLDSIYDAMYRNELRTGRVFTLFTLFTLFVACLGLLGLTSYAAEQRRKEFGIRKTLGATAGGILFLLSREYQRLILIAAAIAWPLSYFLMKQWLQSFAYRTAIGITPFLVSGILILAVSFLTVIFHSVKAARTKPVESLRYE